MRFLSCLLSLILPGLACFPAPPAHAQAVPGAPPNAQTFTLAIPAPPKPAPAGTPGSLLFVGTATLLIRYQGLTILTDPNFLHKGDHVHLGYGLRSQRLTDPALTLEQLPPIDLVLLSHLHEDHFDQLVQRGLHPDTPIVTTVEASGQLARLGFRKRFPLSHWDSLLVRKGAAQLRLTAMPGRHGPRGVAALPPPVMGALLDFADLPGQPRYRMYISGDTLVDADIAQIPQRFPDIDLALLQLGGPRILRIIKVTTDGRDGLRMLQLIAPRKAIPIHFNDYDVFASPLSDFSDAVRAAGLAHQIIYLKLGESYTFVAPPE